jgi:hypothetical protein
MIATAAAAGAAEEGAGVAARRAMRAEHLPVAEETRQVCFVGACSLTFR